MPNSFPMSPGMPHVDWNASAVGGASGCDGSSSPPHPAAITSSTETTSRIEPSSLTGAAIARGVVQAQARTALDGGSVTAVASSCTVVVSMLNMRLILALLLVSGCAGRAKHSMTLYESGDYAGASRAADEGLANHPD